MMPAAKKVTRDLENPLVYLPRKNVAEYRRGQIVYDESHPSIGLYLVAQGRVKVSLTMEDGTQSVTGILSGDEFFGESALLGLNDYHERAVPLETTTLMSWTIQE